MTAATERLPRAFQFERDTFAFAHELVWKYRFDSATGRMTTYRADPPPSYYHRCFVIVRSVRQFFEHARFAPELPPAEPDAYRNLIRTVVRRNPRRTCAEPDRVVVPGFDGLRSFSRTHESILKAECGGPVQSYFLRSHWRMVFPVWGRHQARIARGLERSLHNRGNALVHLFRFPHITINHGIVLFASRETEGEIQFEAYDPNLPESPVALTFDRSRKKFLFGANCYWGGGPLSVVEIFRGGLY